MKKYSVGLAFALALIWVAQSWAQEKAPLRLVQTVSVPGAPRKWDHFGVDLQGNRLFATSEDAPAVEVFDLRTNKLIRTLTDFKEPHNVLPFPDLKQIFVVDGAASEIKILNYDSYQLVSRTELTIDADPIVYETPHRNIFTS